MAWDKTQSLVGPSGPAGPQGPAGADSTVPGPTGPVGPTGPEGSSADSWWTKSGWDTLLPVDPANQIVIAGGVVVGRGGGYVFTNTAVGSGALKANTTPGMYNTAFGKDTLLTNIDGAYNTATGSQTLYSNISGGNNTATGADALLLNSTGANNNAYGRDALRNNTTGVYNIANGVNALYSNTIGSNNIANGFQALYSNSTGYSNVASGVSALQLNKTGFSNTAIGVNAGNMNTTGNNNTFIGFESAGASNAASNVITLGNGAITTLRCQVTTITSLSDARDKTNISNIPAGLDFINALRPVAFDWNTRDGAKIGIPEFGFIAQELQEAQASTGITVPNLVSTVNADKLETSAGTLLPVLAKAVQELTAMVRDLQAEIAALKAS